ncbi:hypothetical protein KKA14_04530 [bacterium]|nr:hypothetical protein [bacterium]
MKRVLFVLLYLICFTSLLFAQSEKKITDDGNELISEENPVISSETKEQAYNMWSDPLYYQFEKMMPRLAKSIGRLDSRISTLAVTELDFSANIDTEFRKVAGAKLFGQLLMENPKLKLVKCDECNTIVSEIKGGILKIRRGTGSKEGRQELAKKIGVQGFMTAMVIEDNRQLTIVVNVHDANEGRIILSDVITGIPVAETTYWNFYVGQMILPVVLLSGEAVSQSAILTGVEYSKRFSESWMLSTNFGIYIDNNSKLENYVELSTGAMFDGSVGWEMMSFMNNDASFILVGGIGQFFSPQFNFSIYGKFGTKIIVNKLLTFNLYYLMFQETNLEAPTNGSAPKLSGSATCISFGVQF